MTSVREGRGRLVDARSPSWHKKGTIPGAVNIPFSICTAEKTDLSLRKVLTAIGAVAGLSRCASTVDVLDTRVRPSARQAEHRVASTLREATQASTSRRPDPYLAAIQDEATDLSVNAVEMKNQELIRNLVSSSSSARNLETTLEQAGFVVVEKEQSVSTIAAVRYGDAQIFDANREVLSNLDQIHVGQQLRLPIMQ
ncbi:MAG TPA: hypothetical protein EYN73_02970 [Chromatiaceae bacterium]|nr:hypothetical protein [Chromatiaceae bacterium]